MRSFFLPALLVLSVLLSGTAFSDNRLLKGVIQDESGKPVSGAELFVYDSPKTRRQADFISPKTGQDGIFSFPVPSGRYWVIARLRHGEKYGPLLSGDLHSGDPVELDLTESQQELVLTVADIRSSARSKEEHRSDLANLSGTILDQAGRPVASAAVCIWREPLTERMPDIVSAWTDEEGAYALSIPPGRYAVSAALTFPPAAADRRVMTLTVPEGQKTVALNLQLINSKETVRDGHTGEERPSPSAD